MTAGLEHGHKCPCRLTGVLFPRQAVGPFWDTVNIGLGSGDVTY